MSNTITITKGDTGPFAVVSAILSAFGEPINLAAYTATKWRMVKRDDYDTVICNDVTSGITVHPTQTFTAATTDWITCNGHGVKAGDQLVLTNSGGALPAGLATATRYFATEVSPNRFKLAESPSSGAVDITGTGTGTHSFYIVGSVRYQFQAADVDETGFFIGQFIVYDSAAVSTIPHDGPELVIQIVENTR